MYVNYGSYGNYGNYHSYGRYYGRGFTETVYIACLMNGGGRLYVVKMSLDSTLRRAIDLRLFQTF